MGIFFSFKKPVIRQFNYVPRYYDERKDEMKERRERIAKEIKKQQEGEVRRGDADGSSSSSSSLRPGYLKSQRTSSSGINGGVWQKAIVITVAVGVAYYLTRLYFNG